MRRWILFTPLLILASVGFADDINVEALPGSTESTDVAPLPDRRKVEREIAFNPYVFTAHKQNYVLPINYTSRLNTDIYSDFDNDLGGFLKPEEVKFQISLKLKLNGGTLLFEDDALYAGFTLNAWWQLYTKDVSSPFRETNYQPEIYYRLPLPFKPLQARTSWVLGLEHQSNGQPQGFSRSWNRAYSGALFERPNSFLFARLWHRLPEDEKETPLAAEGDDNPDIIDFMGRGEIIAGWRGDKFAVYGNVRGNTRTGKGATEISLSFPMFKRYRGVVQYFNGYGESLIDYNHFQQRFGIGVLLSNLF